MTRQHSHNSDAIWDWILTPLFLLALPIALWKLTGNPIPEHLPTQLDLQLWWNSVQAYPTQAFDIVPRILVDALWIGWAWYAAWLTLGLLWTLLRLPGVIMPRILLRLTPRATVQAITVGAVAASPIAHAAPAAPHTLGAALPANLGGRLHLTVTAAPPAHTHPLIIPADTPAADAHTTVHHVEHGDTLWDLAARYYGDGEQWHRIYAANAGRPQHDAARLTDPDLIYPGWNLAIPNPVTATPAPTPWPGTGAAPRPATTTPPAASDTAPPQTPATPTPDGAPAPGAADTAIPAPGPSDPRQAAPRTPHTVGWHIPSGGYIGITLLAALAASVALLRTRHHRHRDTPPPPIPDAVAALAAVHSAAFAADTCGYDSQEHPGQLPPPLLHPTPGAATLGTAADGRRELPHDRANPAGSILSYTGPGAEDAIRALIISILSATTLADGSGARAVLTDRQLADDLFGTSAIEPLPGWLHLADTPTEATAQLQSAARRHTTSRSPNQTSTDSTQAPYITLILRADPGLHGAVAEACASAYGGVAAVVLGPSPDGEHPVTTITLDQDGTIREVTGLHDDSVEHMTVHTLPRELATDLYRVLRAARTPYPQQIPSEQAHAHVTTAPADPDPTARHSPKTEGPSAHNAISPPAIAVHLAEAPPQSGDEPPSSPLSADDLRTLIRTPLLLRVLGPVDILGPNATAPPNGDKIHMLLARLALHPAGHNARHLADLGWAEIDDEEQRRRAAYTTISRARTPFHTANATNPKDPGKYLVNDHGTFRLDPDQITTDLDLLGRLQQQAAHAADDTERRSLLTQAVALYRGPLAHGVSDDGLDWLTDARFDTHERIVGIHLELAALTFDDDLDAAIGHTQTATRMAPDDEQTTRRAIRYLRQLSRPDLAHAAYQRHVAALHELGEQPSPEILQLAAGSGAAGSRL